MTAALRGLDVLAFSGGVGEHAASLRTRAVDGLGFLGLAVDPTTNAAQLPEADVSSGGATARTCVVHSREDLRITGQVRGLLCGPDAVVGVDVQAGFVAGS